MTVVAMNNFGGCFFFLPSRRCVALVGLARECCSLLPSKACTTLVLCVLVTYSMTWHWFGALWVRQCAHEIGFGSAFSSRLTLPRVRDLAKGITRLLPFASVWRDGRRCEMPSQTALMSFAFTAIQTWTWEWQHRRAHNHIIYSSRTVPLCRLGWLSHCGCCGYNLGARFRTEWHEVNAPVQNALGIAREQIDHATIQCGCSTDALVPAILWDTVSSPLENGRVVNRVSVGGGGAIVVGLGS